MLARDNQKGFTLVEVLVALAIGALVITATMNSLTQGLERTRNSEKVLAARQLAQSRLAEWSKTAETRDAKGVRGDYRWRIEARPYQPASADGASSSLSGKLSEITVTVEWEDERALKSFTLRTFRAELQP